MRKLLLLLLFVQASVNAFSQYNNEWIKHTQEYYKIPIAASGVYRLTYTDLEQVGFPVNTVDPRWISIFHRGVEQSIIVTGQQDADFNTEDYIEFYGLKNDGTLDQALYVNPNDQPHSFYNLYSDTTAYFITWTTGVNGMRMSTYKSNNVNGNLAESFHWSQKNLVNSEEYATGRSYGNYIQLTDFDTGEGWSGVAKQEGQSIDYLLSNITNRVTSDSKPTIEIQLLGRDDKQHQVEILVGPNVSSLRVLETVNFKNYESYKIENFIEWGDISEEGDLLVRCNIQGVDGGNDIASVNYIKLDYPQRWDMSGEGNKFFNSAINSNTTAYLEINNTPVNLNIIDVTDANNPIIIGFNLITNGISAIINNTQGVRGLYAYSSVTTPSIKKVNFNKYDLSSYDYAIISHNSLMKPGGAYANPVLAYADYRNSEQGGSFNTLLLDVEEVFNQYSYGEFSPLAIHKFLEHWNEEGMAEGLFIIGKSILIGSKTVADHYYYRKNPEQFLYKDLVPTAGRPGSDLLYGMGLNGNDDELSIPVGRITASTSEHVAAYLDKMIEYENVELNELWKKNLLHLSGGLSAGELIRFENHVNGFRAIAEDVYLGGVVSSIRKQSNNSVEFINTTELINNGLNLITFFGHSAPNIVDIDIGYVSNPVHGYNNKGKYPMIFVNGCSAGQVFGNNYLWGEDWTLTPDLGAIGFIAHTYYGYESALRDYSNTFYKKAFGDSALIYQSIGKVFQETIKQYRNDFGRGVLDITQTEQMILVGDPALHLFNAKAPDYALKDDDLFFVPYNNSNVDALVDSFAIGAIVKNFGRADKDSIRVRVERTLDDNTMIVYDSVFGPIFNQDTLYVIIYNESNLYAGRNRFRYILDYRSEINELKEDNNTAEIAINLTLNGTKNLLPSQYSVVNRQQINLILQSSNVIGQVERVFAIEIDTVSTFDSPYKKNLNTSGEVLLHTSINLLAQDSLVYYWRTKFDNVLPGENEEWESSSFTYIKNGNPGWMQSHYQQIVDAEFNNLQYDEAIGDFTFEEIEITFDLLIYGANHPTDSFGTVKFEIDGLPYIYPSRLCRDNAINLVAFSKKTGIPYAGIPYPYWIANACGRQSQVINNFKFSQIINSGGISTNTNDNMLEQYLDTINEGDFVLIFTTGDIQFNQWSPELAAQIERVGGNASTIASLGAGEPFILFGTKGEQVGGALEIVTTSTPVDEQSLNLSKIVKGTASSGSVKSTMVGPASAWNSFKNNVKLSELDDFKDFSYDIYGVDNDGTSILKYQEVMDEELDISELETPYLQIVLNLRDTINRTASQLSFWQVEYEGIPEGTLILGDNSEGYTLSKQEGDNFSTNFKFVNVSEHNFLSDSLVVRQRDHNITFGGSYYQDFKIRPPTAGDTTFFTVNTDTYAKVGKNDFFLEVNDYEEIENYYDNNALQLSTYFDVFQDNSNPIVQVLFDGKPIIDGAIISANPIVTITIWDENLYLIKSDTTRIQLFMKHECDECDFDPIYFSSDRINWSLSELEYRIDIEYTPLQLQNGKYIFRLLATDVTGNKIADMGYEIRFEVINESSLTNFYLFPNPMSNSTRFSYQLTGSVLPDVMEVEILNLEGEVIRLISKKELGVIRIGKTVSEFEWDGRDQSGNLLPNGIYIYRLTAYLDGVSLVNKHTSFDSGFDNGTGKIYIIR